jgi:eukaryotic-like serine/threonine-protein kinase
MMPDFTLAHLIRAVDLPDLSGTQYELREEIGRGGMGTVYRAFDRNLQREVALKITDDPIRDQGGEARIAASLEHPGIVPIYDVGTLPDDRGYYVMRLIRGKPLHLHVTAETLLPERISIFLKVCEAVAFAHSRGVIHRDLKPANIMVGEFGDVSILDWGVARRAGKPGDIAGTPSFMAPEQARGEQPTPLADIYSLGRILQSLLPSGAARPLRAIAAKASLEEPSSRYSSAQAIRADLNRYLNGFSVEAYHENPAERLIRFVRRNRVLFLLFGAYFAARIAVYIFYGR